MSVRQFGTGFAAAILLITSLVVPPAASGIRESDESTQPVIVVMRDQHDDVPDTPAGAPLRKALIEADQLPVLEIARRAGAQNLQKFSVVNGFAG